MSSSTLLSLLFLACPLLASNFSQYDTDLQERAPDIDCGTWVIDCSKAAGACNNACYYQNCIHGGDVTYRDNGEEEKVLRKKSSANRAQSGVLTSTRPKNYALCRKFPISQRMYDDFITEENFDGPNSLNLETDEWPMAAMTQPDFDRSTTWPPRNALRCIPKDENGNLGNLYSIWRHGEGQWGPGGARERDRKGCKGLFKPGSTFKVKFDISNMDDTTKVPFCEPNARCQNDGYQFHMSKYRPGSDKKGSPGRMGFPYDSTYHNQYSITDIDNQPGIQMNTYQVNVKRRQADDGTGVAFEATVFQMQDNAGQRGGSMQAINTKSQILNAAEDSLTISGLPQDLKISLEGNNEQCSESGNLEFLYGNGNRQTSSWWKLDRLGWGLQVSDTLESNQYWVTVPPKKGRKGKKGKEETREKKIKRLWDGPNGAQTKVSKRNADYLDPGTYCKINFEVSKDDKIISNTVTCYFYGQAV